MQSISFSKYTLKLSLILNVALLLSLVFNIFNGIWIDISFSKLPKGKAILMYQVIHNCHCIVQQSTMQVHKSTETNLNKGVLSKNNVCH